MVRFSKSYFFASFAYYGFPQSAEAVFLTASAGLIFSKLYYTYRGYVSYSVYCSCTRYENVVIVPYVAFLNLYCRSRSNVGSLCLVWYGTAVVLVPKEKIAVQSRQWFVHTNGVQIYSRFCFSLFYMSVSVHWSTKILHSPSLNFLL